MPFSNSFVPSILERGWDISDFPSRIFDHRFSSRAADSMFCPAMYSDFSLRPKYRSAIIPSVFTELKNEKDKFKVMLNVSHFKPEEVQVKVVDNDVVVHAKHEEKSDEHGFVMREFKRRYLLPEEVEADSIKSSLSHNGVLLIEAAKKNVEPLPSNERVIPIILATPESFDEK